MKWTIPTVLAAQELLDKAFRASARIRPPSPAERRNLAGIYLSKIGAVSGVIQSKLSTYVRRFPSVNYLEVGHSEGEKGVARFYYDLFDLTFGVDRMKKALGNLNWGIRKVRELESTHTKQLKRARTKEEMEKIRSAFFGRVSSVVERLSPDLEFLASVREELKRMPDIEKDAVVVVVAGAPNVGKSSLINMLSSGNSAIASYPFTTKGIFLGHLEINRKRLVLVDTPGLLDRPDWERNPAEKKALSALENLASAVIFILDPSEQCGFPIQAQESLLEHVEGEVMGVPLLVVENKVDLLSRETDNMQVSCKTGEGTKAIMEWLKELVGAGEEGRGNGEEAIGDGR